MRTSIRPGPPLAVLFVLTDELRSAEHETLFPPAGVTLAAALPLLAVDIVYPGAGKETSRGIPTHEYGHFTFCSLLFKKSTTQFALQYSNAGIVRLGSNPEATNEDAFVNEGFADFIAGQVVGGVNYFDPGTESMTPTVTDFQRSGEMRFCNATRTTCLDRNFNTRARQPDFRAQVARVMTTLHDAFDGHPASKNLPGSGDYWNIGPPLSAAPAASRAGSFGDEPVSLPGRSIQQLIRSHLKSMVNSELMRALARAMREQGIPWCHICDIFAYHYDEAVLTVPPPPPGGTISPTQTPRQRWDLCLNTIEIIGGYMENAQPPEPFLNLDGNKCTPCPPRHNSPDGVCAACPTDSIAIKNACTPCNLGSTPIAGENQCQCAGARHVNTDDGLCRECSANEIKTGPTTCTPCNLGSTVAPGENRCQCGPLQVNTPDGLCRVDCPANHIAVGGTCVACNLGSTAIPNENRCQCTPVIQVNTADGLCRCITGLLQTADGCKVQCPEQFLCALSPILQCVCVQNCPAGTVKVAGLFCIPEGLFP